MARSRYFLRFLDILDELESALVKVLDVSSIVMIEAPSSVWDSALELPSTLGGLKMVEVL